MDLNYKATNIFPVTLHRFDVTGFDKIKYDLIDYAYELKKLTSKSLQNSNRGGWHSKTFVVKKGTTLLNTFLIDALSGFFEYEIIDKSNIFNLVAWVLINKPNSYNVSDDHPGVDLSGVLWVKTPKNSGNIVFESPYTWSGDSEINSYTEDFKKLNKQYQCHYFEPREGSLLIFPPYIKHSVSENKSNEDRISVPFNLTFYNPSVVNMYSEIINKK